MRARSRSDGSRMCCSGRSCRCRSRSSRRWRVGLQAMVEDGRDGGRDHAVSLPQVPWPRPAVGDHPRQDGFKRSLEAREGGLPTEQFVQDDAQRIDVAAGIDGPATAAEVLQVLGGHVGEGSPHARRRGTAAELGVVGEVEVKQHRLPFVGQQDVGRLEVAVDDAALVSVLQALAHARADPQHGLDVIELFQALQVGRGPQGGFRRPIAPRPRGWGRETAAGWRGRARGLPARGGAAGLVQGANQDLAGGRQRIARCEIAEDVPQGGRSEVGHADGLVRAGLVDRVNGDDVGVLQLGQRL